MAAPAVPPPGIPPEHSPPVRGNAKDYHQQSGKENNAGNHIRLPPSPYPCPVLFHRRYITILYPQAAGFVVYWGWARAYRDRYSVHPELPGIPFILNIVEG